MRLVLLGAPGSGKGTQAGIISERLGIVHIASGDLFRQAANRDDELGDQVKNFMEKGLLVPDEITIRMILERIGAPDCRSGFILDGFPRTLEQAKALDRELGEMGEDIEQVIYMKVSMEELVRRLGGRYICRKCQTPYHQVSSPPKASGVCDKCGGELYQRSDDLPGTVRQRLDVYLQETAPLIDYYKQAGKLVEIEGEGEASAISNSIVSAMSRS